MLRVLPIFGLAVAFGIGAITAAVKKPPSSLQNAGAVLRFTHLHERVVSCKNVPGGAACAERRVRARSGTTLTLSPIPNRLVSEPEHGRTPLAVSLPDGQGQSSREEHVERGAWRLSWADQEVAFQVESQRNFNVQLRTTSGACVLEQGECRRHDELIARNVVIPPEFLGTP